jgi:hypothetical protein
MVGDFRCVLSYTNSTTVVGLVYGKNADPANFTYASENNAAYDNSKTSFLEAFSSSTSSMGELKCLYQQVGNELATSTATVYIRARNPRFYFVHASTKPRFLTKMGHPKSGIPCSGIHSVQARKQLAYYKHNEVRRDVAWRVGCQSCG